MIAEIAFPIPVNKLFTYSIPENLKPGIFTGIRVRAPFGVRDLTGWVVNIGETTEVKNLKSIKSIIDDEPLITPALLKLARWMADYYVCSLGQALDTVISHKWHPVKSRDNKPQEKAGSSLAAWLPLPGQKTIIDRISRDINKGGFSPFLLMGASDTGKTEVYMQCIAAVHEKGGASIFLVPEISLTPQFIKIFEERFGRDRVGVWHSRLTPGQRYAVHQACRNGAVDVLIGTMSAVFLPCKNTGLIIVDEEQDGSYKHDRAPVYNTRDVAVKRAELEAAAVILGSSTPSFESYYKAQQGKYKLLSLSGRIGQEELPSVKIVDMKDGFRGPGKYFRLSSELYRAVEEKIGKKEQVILFLNRRGYFRHVICRACGSVMKCPECSISLVYHIKNKRLKCHYCGYRKPLPRACPECGREKIGFSGSGPQRIEKELAEKIPGAKIVRLDSDALKDKKSLERIYSDFSRGRANILIGTQLVAKGWDFPGVSLVGIVSADDLLYLPDFRANERFFSTMVQAAGRSGRGAVKGEMLIQTYNPSDAVIKKIVDYDYESFYTEEMKIRQELGYPPFTQLVNIIVSGKDEKTAEKHAGRIKEVLDRLVSGESGFNSEDTVTIIGPVPASFYRLRGNFRWQIIIKRKLPSGDFLLQETLRKMLSAVETRRFKIKTDFDPSILL